MVSGGADSTCLMHVLAAIHDGPITVLSIDHGLRPEAGDEVLRVGAQASALGLRCEVRTLELEDGPDLQERARDARAEIAHELAEEIGAAGIATGHTASDQAETVLFRLARGAGLGGALAMAPRRELMIRPLLGVTREQAERWCDERGLSVVDDPSNADPRFTRSRVRHELLPALERIHPGAARNVAAFSDRLRDERSLIDATIDAGWTRCVGCDGLRRDALSAESLPLRRLLVRRLLERAGLPGGAREQRHVERVLDLVERPARIQLPGGLAEIVDGELVVAARERVTL